MNGMITYKDGDYFMQNDKDQLVKITTNISAGKYLTIDNTGSPYWSSITTADGSNDSAVYIGGYSSQVVYQSGGHDIGYDNLYEQKYNKLYQQHLEEVEKSIKLDEENKELKTELSDLLEENIKLKKQLNDRPK